jgi:hypothetical protein
MIEHQQKGSMTLAEFAALHGLTEVQVRGLAKGGRIMGAQRKHTGHWLIFPPAKILGVIRIYAPRKRPAPYDDQRVKEAHHVLTLATAKQLFTLQLSGTQLLMIERLLVQACEELKQKRFFDGDEELEEARTTHGQHLQCLYTCLHVFRAVEKQGSRS